MLFEPIKLTPLGEAGAQGAKVLMFLIGAAWSVWLGERILARQGVPSPQRRLFWEFRITEIVVLLQ